MNAPQRWMQVFDEYLSSQESPTASLEQRGARIPAVSGSIITALAAIAAFRPEVARSATGGWVLSGLIILAIAAFSLAVLLSIGVQVPRPQERLDQEGLEALAASAEYWQDDANESVALQRTAELKAKISQSTRGSNQTKARWLIWAYACQAIGIVCVAAAVVWALAVTP